MTKGIRYGLALLCVAALAAVMAAVASESVSPVGDFVGSLSRLTLLLAGAAGLLTLAVSLVRGSRPPG